MVGGDLSKYPQNQTFVFEGVHHFWKILMQPGLKYLHEPAIFMVYSGFSYYLEGTSNYYQFIVDVVGKNKIQIKIILT